MLTLSFSNLRLSFVNFSPPQIDSVPGICDLNSKHIQFGHLELFYFIIFQKRGGGEDEGGFSMGLGITIKKAETIFAIGLPLVHALTHHPTTQPHSFSGSRGSAVIACDPE